MMPFRLLNDSHIARIREKFSSAFRRWSMQYAFHEFTFSLEPLVEEPDPNNLELIHPALQITKNWISVVSICLFGEDNPAFHASARKASSALFSALCPDSFQENSWEQGWFCKGTSCLKMIVYCDDHQIELYLHPDWVYAQFLPKPCARAALTPLDDALAQQLVTLEIRLQTFPLSMQTLLDMEPGDLLSTEQLLTQPWQLTCNNYSLAEAAAGTLGNHKSIVLERFL